MNRRAVISVIFTILFLSFLPANSQIKLKPEIISPVLGQVIDSQENTTYKIFPDIQGFSAARFYQRGQNDYYLHILRNTETGGKLLIVHLNPVTFSKIKDNILSKISSYDKTGRPSDVLVYPIDETKWVEKTKQKKIRLFDGNEIVGAIVRVSNDTLFVRTTAGLEIPVPDDIVINIQEIHTRVTSGGKFYRVDPNKSRLFFAPTGRALEAGSGYFADYYIFFPTVAYGITDNFALSGGMSIFPGASSQLIYIAPKITFPVSDKVGVSTGLLYLNLPEDADNVGLGYAVSTIGDRFKGITFGVGVSLFSNNNGNMVFLLGGETQVSNRVKLISENWIFTGGDGFTLLSGGLRFFGDRIAVDLAFLTAKDFWENADGFPFIPYVDFSVMFGK